MKRTIELKPWSHQIIIFEGASGFCAHYVIYGLTVMTSVPVSEELLVQYVILVPSVHMIRELLHRVEGHTIVA